MKIHIKIYLITLLSAGILIFLNEVNLTFIFPDFPYKQGLITTADEYSYFSPADQFLNTFSWSENAIGAKAYMRTPGYGIIYLIAKIIGGTNSFLVLKFIQILFFAGSILLFSKILQAFKVSEKLMLFATIIFGLMPMFSGFVYYTLSEAVLPFFTLWSFYAILKADINERISYNVLFSNAFLLIIRPQMLVLTLLLMMYFLVKRKRIFWSLFLAFVPLFIWNIRTVAITGEWLGMNPIYSIKNNSLYREPHKEMTDLFRVWEFRGDYFHSSMALLSRDTAVSTTQEVLQTIPKKYQAAVRPILIEFQKFRNLQRTKYSNKNISNYLPGEFLLIKHTRSLREVLIHNNPIDYYIKTPLKSFKKLMMTSMMNLYVFQEPWKDLWLIIILKYSSFLIISFGLISSFFHLRDQSNVFISLSAICIIISIFYLSFVQRFNEERYLLPYLSLMFIHSILFINKVFRAK